MEKIAPHGKSLEPTTLQSPTVSHLDLSATHFSTIDCQESVVTVVLMLGKRDGVTVTECTRQNRDGVTV